MFFNIKKRELCRNEKFRCSPLRCVRISKMQGIEGEGDWSLQQVNDLARIPIIMRQFAIMTHRPDIKSVPRASIYPLNVEYQHYIGIVDIHLAITILLYAKTHFTFYLLLVDTLKAYLRTTTIIGISIAR